MYPRVWMEDQLLARSVMTRMRFVVSILSVVLKPTNMYPRLQLEGRRRDQVAMMRMG